MHSRRGSTSCGNRAVVDSIAAQIESQALEKSVGWIHAADLIRCVSRDTNIQLSTRPYRRATIGKMDDRTESGKLSSPIESATIRITSDPLATLIPSQPKLICRRRAVPHPNPLTVDCTYIIKSETVSSPYNQVRVDRAVVDSTYIFFIPPRSSSSSETVRSSQPPAPST